MMEQQKRLNVRVYGLLINPRGEILLSEEEKGDWKFTKFPGGGLEWGEGIVECLKREFLEETGLEVEVNEHFYTTEFFQESAFRKNDQLISIYYKVKTESWEKLTHGQLATDAVEGEMNRFYWRALSELEPKAVTYPIDQLVLTNILEIHSLLPS